MAESSIASSESVVRGNIIRYKEEVASNVLLQRRMSQVWAWYAVKVEGRWQFAPSKFAGYANLDATTYLANSKDNNGRTTESHLSKWFKVVSHDNSQYDDLHIELSQFLNKFGKCPSRAARINVSKIEDVTVSSDEGGMSEIVDLILAVARLLPNQARRDLNSRLSQS